LGFIGNEVVRQLARRGEVSVIDNYARAAGDIADLAGVRVFRADITDGAAVAEAMGAAAPDVVVHLAAIHFIPECNANPALTLRVNVEGTLSVLLACKAHGVKHTLFASSGAVYADSARPLTEDSPVAPVDVYGLSKKMAEEVCTWLARSHGLPVTILRLFNAYGPRETNAHIIPEIIAQLKRGNALRLGNVKPRRDYVYVTDVAAAIAALAGRVPEPLRVLNLSSGHSASVEDLVGRIGKLLGRDLTIAIDPDRFRTVDKMVQTADIQAIAGAAGWQPAVDLDAGLRELLRYEGLL
jgi:UDP-glucose 4-epimerase